MVGTVIKSIVSQGKRVIIPDFGAFLIKDSSLNPIITKENVTFSPFLRYNDGFLESELAHAEGLHKDEASAKLTDFIQKIKEIANENSTPDEFYLSHLMKMLVEKLLLDPNCPLNPGKVNLYEMIFSPPYPKKTQALFSLNERLQLIEYLINHLHFHPDAKQMQICGQNHYIKVILRTK